MSQASSLLRRCFDSNRAFIITGGLALICVDLIDTLLPLILKQGFDEIQGSASIDLIHRTALLYFSAAALQAVLRFVYRRFLPRTRLEIGHALRTKIVSHTVTLPVALVKRSPVGEYLTLTSSDAENVAVPFDLGLIMFFDGFLYLVMTLAVTLWLSPWLAILILAPLFLVPLIMRRSEAAVRLQASQTQSALGRMTNRIHETISGIEFLKSIAREKDAATTVGVEIEKYRQAAIQLTRREASVAPRLEVMGTCSTVLLLLIGGPQLMAGAITLGTFVAFYRYIDLLAWPMQALAFWVSLSQRARSSADRISDIFEQKPDIKIRSSETDPAIHKIELKDLTYKYESDQREVLNCVNLSIKAGEKVAILGDNGSGKSTLLRLLSKLTPVPPGMIFAGSKDLTTIDAVQWRESIAGLPQEAFLFSGPIFDTLALPTACSREQADTLLRQLGLGHLAKEERLVGEQGLMLSGGQRQRLALARALLRDRAIVLMDDPLSGVDAKYEAEIVTVLREILHSKTVIFTTNRLKLLEIADRIVVLESGKIVQQGSLSELSVQPDGWFKKFHEHARLIESIEAFHHHSSKEAHE